MNFVKHFVKFSADDRDAEYDQECEACEGYLSVNFLFESKVEELVSCGILRNDNTSRC
jgi:hypothetical protein